jgi:hypothetical protein
VVGQQDELVGPHHVEAMYKLHNGPHQLFQFPGGHNSPRPINFFVQALQFLRVMVGLLPLPSEVFTNLGAASPPSSSARPAKAKVPVKVFKNPLPPDVSVESVHQMSVKELKEAISSVGYGDVPCVEKHDLIDLVLKLHARHVRSKQHAELYSNDDLSPGSKKTASKKKSKTKSSSPSPSDEASGSEQVRPSHTVASTSTDSFDRPRRHSDSSAEATPVGASSTSAEAETSKPFPMKAKTSSVLSDVELSRELSGGGLKSDGEEDEKHRA